jgi:hypothetical protein
LEVLEDRTVLSILNTTAFATGVFGFGGAQPAQPIATTTTVSSSANPGGFGQVVTFTATVAAQNLFGGTPTGTVQFAIDGMNSGRPVNVSTTKGVTTATYSTLLLLLGQHTITANYSGDGSFAASSGSLTQTVHLRSMSTTMVSSSSNSASLGQTVTFTATVSGVNPNAVPPTGTVQFYIDGNTAGTPVSLTTTAGVSTASYSAASLSGGPHIASAVYSGDANFNISSGYILGLVEVAPADTTTTVSSSSNPSGSGQSVTFTAKVSLPNSVSVVPTGTVQFFVDGTIAGVATLAAAGNGLYTASYTSSSLAAGTHTVIATYSGDVSFTGSSGSLKGGQVVGNGPSNGGGGGGVGSGSGNVIVTLNPITGLLNIFGYNDNDALTLSQGGNTLQVAGNGTLVNQSSSPASFPLGSVHDIAVSLLNGNDSLAINNFNIPGTLSIFAGSGSDNFSVGAISAGLIRISVAGPGNSTISLNNITAGTTNIAAGDNATLALSGVNNTGAVLLTAGNKASISVIGLTTSGDLNIIAADNAQSITVKNSSSNNVSILQTGTAGNPAFDLENDTISTDLRLTAGGGNNSLVLSHLTLATRMFVTLGSGNNTVNADHVTALFGTLDGGSGGSNTYNDGGSNSGFAIFDFNGK